MYPSGGRQDFGGAVGGAVVEIVLIVLTVLVFGFVIVLFLTGGALVTWLKEHNHQSIRTADEGPPPPSRLFGSPHEPQWLLAYDYWIFQLERFLGIEFSASEVGIFCGATIVSAGPALLVGGLFALLDPVHGAAWLVGITALGGAVGIISGKRLVQPVNWFEMPVRLPDQRHSDGGFTLGDEL